jgi:hypothetical protein
VGIHILTQGIDLCPGRFHRKIRSGQLGMVGLLDAGQLGATKFDAGRPRIFAFALPFQSVLEFAHFRAEQLQMCMQITLTTETMCALRRPLTVTVCRGYSIWPKGGC